MSLISAVDKTSARGQLVTRIGLRVFTILLGCMLLPRGSYPQEPRPGSPENSAGHVIGPDDEITLRVLDADELSNTPFHVDSSGNIEVPLIGRVHCAGLTIKQLDSVLENALKAYIREPQVTARVTQLRSRPVSVLGAVRTPGVHQLEGETSLVEMLSAAGGLSPEAGTTITVRRKPDQGSIPLPGAKDDSGFSIVELKTEDAIGARHLGATLMLRPGDVITVPRAEAVYVLGEVKRAGGFPLREHEQMSVLQALSLAEGLSKTASAKNARILRVNPNSINRTEIAVNLPGILDGKQKDVAMQPNDILFVPNSLAKNATLRGLEAAVQAGTGIAIWRRPQ